MPGRRGTAGRPGHGTNALRIVHRFRTACTTVPTSVTLTHAVAFLQHPTVGKPDSFDLEVFYQIVTQPLIKFDTAGLCLAPYESIKAH